MTTVLPESLRHGPLGVCEWDTNARTIAGESFPTNGNFSVADPRLSGVRHNNVFRIVKWDQNSPAVTGGQSPTAGGLGVADPRPNWENRYGNLHVADWQEPSKTVIAGGKGVQGGWLSVADPRYQGESMGQHTNKMRVVDWDNSMPTVTGSNRVGSGALSVADPRCLHREKGDNYLTGGHYGVVPLESSTGAVSASAGCDNGRWSVADPRMPEQDEKCTAIIRALDGTWHRPFTTMELAALQSLIDPEEMLQLDGNSDSAHRERIGNAVPPGRGGYRWRDGNHPLARLPGPGKRSR